MAVLDAFCDILADCRSSPGYQHGIAPSPCPTSNVSPLDQRWSVDNGFRPKRAFDRGVHTCAHLGHNRQHEPIPATRCCCTEASGFPLMVIMYVDGTNTQTIQPKVVGLSTLFNKLLVRLYPNLQILRVDIQPTEVHSGHELLSLTNACTNRLYG